MRIAVTSQNFKTITGHAGKSRRFLIYELEPGREPVEIERLDLPKDRSLHDDHGPDHPLYQRQLTAILTGGAGGPFVQRMNREGIEVITTSETDIAAALRAIASDEALPPAAPHEH
ncbi:MAG: NifB/NifX family molybdenum-iron cluster-binding protein [Halochromatium sp.]